ncbi:hypothetical protein [Fictibacillus gelatini]|uniref:hypothetical protein n=1 Tax=Fictibacillus gelatini TaxID=225985 RepID=UPI0004022CF1|nr:hypothetical protein [Fictibacillus gelatini]
MELSIIAREIYEATHRLAAAGNEVYRLAKEKADTERDYRLALSKEILILKSEGMSVTLVSDVARGNVADLKHKRDLAEGKYKASIEALKSIQAQVNALQSILKFQSEV